MPQLYNNAVITTAGSVLLDRVQAGLAAIQFTRMATGDGTYTAEEKQPSALRGSTGLKSSRNSYTLSSAGTIPGGGVRLTALITNQDPATSQTLVSEGYSITEIGLFAKERDGAGDTEVLYSITVATGDTGDYLPAYTGGAPAQIVQEYRAKVSDAASVSINSAGAVMLAEDAERRFSAIEEAIEGAGGGLIEDETPTFEQAEERENIASGESMGTILGKIKKFFADLKKVAFTGSYNDLSDTPSLFSGKYEDLSGKPDLFSGDYNDLANKPTASDLGIVSIQGAVTLSADWTGEGAPFTQTVAVPGVMPDSVVDIDVAGTVTSEQLDAYIGARIVDGGQAAGSITLKVLGEKPTVAIPLRVVVRRV